MTTILAESALDSTVTFNTDSAHARSIPLGKRGKWGGLIVLGNAPTSASSPKEIEGISGKTYGGTDPTDSSGTLQYVRVWHGGAYVAADNEINGITLGGVGSGTTIDHCEVAHNADDGFEFFGGTVNVKYLSVLFAGDDAFDSDEGYQGKGQFLFAMTGTAGNHGTEMDSKTNSNFDSMPRSHPAFYSMTIIAGGSTSNVPSDAVMRLREGTGGKFGNLILANLGGTHKGIEIKDCGSEPVTQTMPEASTSLGVAGEVATSGYLYVSSNALIGNPLDGSEITVASGCNGPATMSFLSGEVISASDESVFTESSTATIPLQPACGSAAYSGVDSAPDAFYDAVGFKGAFGNDIWLKDWSYIDSSFSSRLPTAVECGSVGAVGTAPAGVGGDDDDDKMPGWGVALFVIIALMAICMLLLLILVISREKSGKPIFMQMDVSSAGRGEVKPRAVQAVPAVSTTSSAEAKK